MLKHCEFCNKEFETIYPNKKYCGNECKRESDRVADKLRKRKARQEVKAIQNAELEEKERIRREKWLQDTEEAHNNRLTELKKQARAGDPFARMELNEPNSKKYWEAYKKGVIEYALSWDRASTATVNNISVNDPDFAQKVVQSIEELGIIHTKL